MPQLCKLYVVTNNNAHTLDVSLACIGVVQRRRHSAVAAAAVSALAYTV